MPELQRPRGLNIEESTDSYGRFSAHPFERGYGVTVGNALRRVLISSIEGAAVTAVRFEGVQHELSTIKGVKEDTMDIILNLKRIPIKVHGPQPRRMRVEASKPGAITSGDIKTDPNVEILDPDVPIATLTSEGELNLEMLVRNARGHVPAEQNREDAPEVGFIPVDSTHSPVRRVNYRIEPARVGQNTDFDKLLLEIFTDGSVTPLDALAVASRLLREMLGIFVGEEGDSDDLVALANPDQVAFDRHRYMSIDDLSDQLSIRAYNGLKNAHISTVGELVVKSEKDLLKERNIGRKSIEEITRILANMDLRLDMGVNP